MSGSRAKSAATDEAEAGAVEEQVTASSNALTADHAPAEENEYGDDQAGSGESSSATTSQSRSKKRGGSRKKGRNSAAPRSRTSKASQSAEADERAEVGKPADDVIGQQQSTVKLEEGEEGSAGGIDAQLDADDAEEDRQRSANGLKELAGLGLQSLGDGQEEPLMPRRSRRSAMSPNDPARRETKEEDALDRPKEVVEQEQEQAVEPVEVEETKPAAEPILEEALAPVVEAVIGEEEEGGEEGVTRCLCGSAGECMN